MPDQTQVEGRPILDAPLDADGFFAKPKGALTKDQEVMFAKLRMRGVRTSNYADARCGLPNTYDETGAYLCGGRKNGSSPSCNMFVILNHECLLRDPKVINKPHNFSCGFWEQPNTGDPEGRRCPSGRWKDERLSAGSTDNPLGFSCERCEYGQQQLDVPDSEGRTEWCKYHGHPVFKPACCADNEPVGVKVSKRSWLLTRRGV
jgi:hypothetical protein